jgi:hypothetical protein
MCLGVGPPKDATEIIAVVTEWARNRKGSYASGGQGLSLSRN